MSRMLVAALTVWLLPLAAFAQDPQGDWRGTLQAGAVKMRIALHLGENSTMDSPDQGASGVPARMTHDGPNITVAIAGVGSFEGSLTEDGKTLSGALVQGAARMPITFERGVFSAAKRPQTPTKPYPYREVEARYDNPMRAGVKLAGTLTLPPGTGPFPAVMLITGSGPQDRDETILEHKPFLVVADDLTRRGIAVLRVDDRGTGGSTGAGQADTSVDYASDVDAGLAWLKARSDIDPKRVGLIGHSEGAVIAPMVAAHDPSVAFLVLWAPPAVPGRDVVVEQVRGLNVAAGAPPEAVARSVAFQGALLDAIMAAPDPKSALDEGTKVARAAGIEPSQLRSMVRPWYRYFLAHDPAGPLRALRIPVLALLGGKDTQVTAEQNLEPLRIALTSNPKAQVAVLPNLNHLFQTARTGSVNEYGQIEETVAPIALKRIGDWVIAQVEAP